MVPKMVRIVTLWRQLSHSHAQVHTSAMLASSLALITDGGPAHTCGNTTLPVLAGVDFVASWNNAAEHDPVIGSSSFVDTELGG